MRHSGGVFGRQGHFSYFYLRRMKTSMKRNLKKALSVVLAASLMATSVPSMTIMPPEPIIDPLASRLS